MKYVAFLRGINVGGHKKIKMDDLRMLFTVHGFTGVQTYIQSGNVVFESKSSPKTIIGKISKKLGGDIIVLSAAQMKKTASNRALEKPPKGSHVFVTFLSKKSPVPKGNEYVEIAHTTQTEIYCICRLKNGKFVFPNGFFESKLKIPATTRNWNTVKKMASML